MAYQAPYDFSSTYPFQMDQQMDKVVVQEKIFPNKSLQMTTRVKFKIRSTNVINVHTYIHTYIHMYHLHIVICVGGSKQKSALFIYHKVASVLYEK